MNPNTSSRVERFLTKHIDNRHITYFPHSNNTSLSKNISKHQRSLILTNKINPSLQDSLKQMQLKTNSCDSNLCH